MPKFRKRKKPDQALEQFLRIYGVRAEVRAWYIELLAMCSAYGSDLVEAIHKPDNTVTACKALKLMEAAGYISRVAWRPSPSQRFLGVGGMSMKQVEKYEGAPGLPWGKEFHAECWLYAAGKNRW